MSLPYTIELQPKEAVASVARIPAPDVADKGAASTHLWDLDQPLLHGMESTAASNVSGPPGAGCSPAGGGADLYDPDALCRPTYRRRDLARRETRNAWVIVNDDLLRRFYRDRCERLRAAPGWIPPTDPQAEFSVFCDLEFETHHALSEAVAREVM